MPDGNSTSESCCTSTPIKVTLVLVVIAALVSLVLSTWNTVEQENSSGSSSQTISSAAAFSVSGDSSDGSTRTVVEFNTTIATPQVVASRYGSTSGSIVFGNLEDTDPDVSSRLGLSSRSTTVESILPTADAATDLGSTLLRFKNAYFSDEVFVEGDQKVTTVQFVEQKLAEKADTSYIDSRIEDIGNSHKLLSAKAGVHLKTTGELEGFAALSAAGQITTTQTMIDNRLMKNEDRILVTEQKQKQHNGIYTVKIDDDVSNPNKITMHRSADADSDGSITSHSYVFVSDGDTQKNTGWIVSTVGKIEIGTTEIDWVQFNGNAPVNLDLPLVKKTDTNSTSTWVEPTSNAQIDLGSTDTKFKDAYFSGNVFVGGTGTTTKLATETQITSLPIAIDTTTNTTTVLGNGNTTIVKPSAATIDLGSDNDKFKSAYFSEGVYVGANSSRLATETAVNDLQSNIDNLGITKSTITLGSSTTNIITLGSDNTNTITLGSPNTTLIRPSTNPTNGTNLGSDENRFGHAYFSGSVHVGNDVLVTLGQLTTKLNTTDSNFQVKIDNLGISNDDSTGTITLGTADTKVIVPEVDRITSLGAGDSIFKYGHMLNLSMHKRVGNEDVTQLVGTNDLTGMPTSGLVHGASWLITQSGDGTGMNGNGVSEITDWKVGDMLTLTILNYNLQWSRIRVSELATVARPSLVRHLGHLSQEDPSSDTPLDLPSTANLTPGDYWTIVGPTPAKFTINSEPQTLTNGDILVYKNANDGWQAVQNRKSVTLEAPRNLSTTYSLKLPQKLPAVPVVDNGDNYRALMVDHNGTMSFWPEELNKAHYIATKKSIHMSEAVTQADLVMGTPSSQSVEIGHKVSSFSASPLENHKTQNVAIGYGAFNYQWGGQNTCVGFGAMGGSLQSQGPIVPDTCTKNVAIGHSSMAKNTEGKHNVAVGFDSMYWSTTGTDNVAIGFQSMVPLTTGTHNTSIGVQSGKALMTGSHNVHIGYKTGISSDQDYGNDAEGNICIGNRIAYRSGSTYGSISIGIGIRPITQQCIIGNTGGPDSDELDSTYWITTIRPAVADVTDLGTIAASFKDAHLGGSLCLYQAKGSNSSYVADTDVSCRIKASPGMTTAFDLTLPSALPVQPSIFDPDPDGKRALMIDHEGKITFLDGPLTPTPYDSTNLSVLMWQPPSSVINNELPGTVSDKSVEIGYGVSSHIDSKDASTGSVVTYKTENVAIGYRAFRAQYGGKNTCLGYGAMGGNSSGQSFTGTDRESTYCAENVAIGHTSMANNTEGIGAVAIGYSAAFNQTLPQYNVAIGYECQKMFNENHSAPKCISVGAYSMSMAQGTVSSCISIGYESMNSINTATYCIAIGHASMKSAISTSKSVVIGYQAGEFMNNNSSVVANYNVAIGSHAGRNLNGDNNIVIGESAGLDLQGSNCTAIGVAALRLGSTGNSTGAVAIGYHAAYNVKTATFNIAIGYECQKMLDGSQTADYCTSIGPYSMSTATVVSNCISIGYESMKSINTATNCIAIGIGVMAESKYTSESITIGDYAGAHMNSNGSSTVVASSNIVVGNRAGDYLAGSHNVAIGSFSMRAPQTPLAKCIAIGYNSMNTINTATDCIAIGFSCMNSAKSTKRSVVIGHMAGYGMNRYFGTNHTNEALDNVVIGTSAGQYLNGSNNVAIGKSAGFTNSGDENVMIGHQSGDANEGKWCTSVGAYSGRKWGDRNTALGYGAASTLAVNSTGNIFMGYASGAYKDGAGQIQVNSNGNYTLTNCIFIGSGIAPGTNHNGSMVIGNNIDPIAGSMVLGNRDISGNKLISYIIPDSDSAYDLGYPVGYRWKTVYASGGVSPFTGLHMSKNDLGDGIKDGLILSSDGSKTRANKDDVLNAEIHVRLSTTKNDRAVVGVSYRKKLLDGKYEQHTYTASVGEGAMWVLSDGTSDALTVGDYITSSGIQGYGTKQSDDLYHNYTVAKILNDEPFTSDFEDVKEGTKTYRARLVPVIFLAG